MHVDPYSFPENQKSPRFWVEIIALSTIFFGGITLATHFNSSDSLFSSDNPFRPVQKQIESRQKMIERTIDQDLKGEYKLNFGKEIITIKDGNFAPTIEGVASLYDSKTFSVSTPEDGEGVLVTMRDNPKTDCSLQAKLITVPSGLSILDIKTDYSGC
ncbi:hypothetical protein QX249_11855 [Vibrio parahaemolyticus]|uniref:Uncharacterized protein n=1 Tax=Vibrio parahaemolyticus TaxID=670 RepID=A0AAW8Q250_VIBPH|nr:hypothetical protein [Vibrio parahaemolyticus]EGR2227307.1 hypothetical protein [Vibrio parahaemolyticus]MDS1821355.1 hypothetical protein [Vibrio parahaemolyticus]